jgi:hypothetical protein
MRTKEQIEAEIARLQEELQTFDYPDWDQLVADNEVNDYLLNTPGSNGGWNSWEKCPVGSLLPDSLRLGRLGCPKDVILQCLGMILLCAYTKNYSAVVLYIRKIARLRIEELNN